MLLSEGILTISAPTNATGGTFIDLSSYKNLYNTAEITVTAKTGGTVIIGATTSNADHCGFIKGTTITSSGTYQVDITDAANYLCIAQYQSSVTISKLQLK